MIQTDRIPRCSYWGAYDLLVRDGRIVGRPGKVALPTGAWPTPGANENPTT